MHFVIKAKGLMSLEPGTTSLGPGEGHVETGAGAGSECHIVLPSSGSSRSTGG